MTLKQRLSLLLSLAICLVPNSLQTKTASAQKITSDGTTATTVTNDGNNYTIQDGTRNGGNLFHSFQDFSVPNGGSASFNNGNDISNILSRVTGGNISNIDGLIRANGSANLFLINPAGIIFGEGASLAIGGSFYGSTADSILFEDGEFSAVNNLDAPILTINAPIGLNFRDNPGDIVNNSVANDGTGLRVEPDTTLALVGGNITFNSGVINAPGANVKLASLASGGNIDIDENLNLTLAENITQADILFADAATVDVAGDGSGSIAIEAGNVDLNQGSLLINAIGENLDAANSQAGDITLNVSDAINLSGGSFIQNTVGIEAKGDSGNINITTSSLELIEGSSIGTGTVGRGDAGNVTINASDSVFVGGEDLGDAGTESVIFSAVEREAVGDAGGVKITTTNLNLTNTGRVSATTFAQGDAGGIDITTANLNLTNGSRIAANTSAQGNAGTVIINASDTISIDGENQSGFNSGITSGVDSDAVGDAGSIEITTANLNLTNSGTISTTTLGQGNAGSININATNTISIDGENQGRFLTGINSVVDDDAVGNGGGVKITTTNLDLINGGVISTGTSGQGNAGTIDINASDSISITGIDQEGSASIIESNVNTDAVGNAGGVNISTTDLFLSNSGISARTAGQGNAGNITIDASNNIELADSLINNDVSAFGLGKGGQITITGKSILLSEGSTIGAATFPNDENVDTEQVPGGNIELNVTESLSITGNSFLISNTFGKGNAGNIMVNGKGANIVLENNVAAGEENVENSGSGSIFSASFNSDGNTIGDAGDITITAKSLTLSGGGFIDSSASGGTGSGGDITINVAENFDIIDSEIDSSATLNDEMIVPIGDAGTIEITTASLNLINGGEVSTNTFGEGNAGTVTINATNTISLDGVAQEGTNSQISSTVANGAAGDAGGVVVSTPNLVIDNGAVISANTFGEGDGGDITLTISDRLTLKENGTISVQASEANANGGNITINAVDGLIVAFPNEIDGDGSDISAFSNGGAGGNITIEAQGVFGIEERSAIPGNNTNDIDASGNIDDGSVEIVTPNSDAIQAPNQLPSVPVEAGETIVQACSSQRGIASNDFVIKGKGGVPNEPGAILSSEIINTQGDAVSSQSASEDIQPISTSKGDIVLARGVKVNQDGGITLTAYRTEKGSRNAQKATTCN